jgi:hypothetical protein
MRVSVTHVKTLLTGIKISVNCHYVTLTELAQSTFLREVVILD